MRKGQRFIPHGYSPRGNATPEYRTWVAMVSRCTDSNVKTFKDYGGRGIKVCVRWRRSFVAFLEDVGPRPSAKHSIDRYPNKNGDYKPSNVRWATAIEQQNNRRSTIYVKYKGKRVPIATVYRKLGLRPGTIWMRIKRGMTPEQAITLPVPPYRGKRF